MYDELVKQLRNSCRDCKLFDGYDCCLDGDCTGRVRLQAADAIAGLSASVEGFESTTNMVFEETEGRTVIKFEPKWVPASERLPEDRTRCVTISEDGDYGLGLYTAEFGWMFPYYMGKTEYWMPLPEPPKEETK